MVLNVHSETMKFIRDGGELGKGGYGGWGRGRLYLSLHCHHQNNSCIKMGSDESRFNVSVGSDGKSHKTVSTNHNISEEKGEPKRYRTEVLPLTSLTVRPKRLTCSAASTTILYKLQLPPSILHLTVQASGLLVWMAVESMTSFSVNAALGPQRL